MKKIIVVLAIALLLASPAYALMCEQSQASGGSDMCWTEVKLSPSVAGSVVSAGTVMVYDYASGQLANANLSLAQSGASLVKVATVSADNTRVAGVLQTSIDTNKVSQVKLLVRGLGTVRVSGVVASGDSLVVKAAGATGPKGGLGTVGSQTPSESIATALETSTTDTTANAIITIL